MGIWTSIRRVFGGGKPGCEIEDLARRLDMAVEELRANEGIRLPRQTRRWLRAVEHRLRTRGSCSLAPDELQGWLAYVSMVHRQGKGAGIPDA